MAKITKLIMMILKKYVKKRICFSCWVRFRGRSLRGTGDKLGKQRLPFKPITS